MIRRAGAGCRHSRDGFRPDGLAPELNGRKGVVEGFGEGKGQYAVRTIGNNVLSSNNNATCRAIVRWQVA